MSRDKYNNLKASNSTIRVSFSATVSGGSGYEFTSGYYYELTAPGDTQKLATGDITLDTDGECSASCDVPVTLTGGPDVIDITVTKKWEDSTDTSKRPGNITVNLYKSTDTINPVKTATFSGTGDTWTHTWTGLDKEEGFTYKIKETSITGYTSSVSGNASSGFTITNTLEEDKIDIPVTKKWVNDTPAVRPDKLKVTLTGTAEGGYLDEETYELTGSKTADSWTYTFTNKPLKTSAGKTITYTVTEDESELDEKYTSRVVTGSATTGFTITNTYSPYIIGSGQKGIKIKIKKVIEGTDDPIEGINFKLYYSITDAEVDNIITGIGDLIEDMIINGTHGLFNIFETIIVDMIQNSGMLGAESPYATYGGWFDEAFDRVKDWWDSTWTEVTATLEEITQEVRNNIANLYNNYFADFKSDAINAITSVTNGIRGSIEDVYNDITKIELDEATTDANGECELELTEEDIEQICSTYSGIFEGLDGALGFITGLLPSDGSIDANAIDGITGVFLESIFEVFNPLNNFTLMIEETNAEEKGYIPVANDGKTYIKGLTYTKNTKEETLPDGSKEIITEWELTCGDSNYGLVTHEDDDGNITGFTILSPDETTPVIIENKAAIKELRIQKTDALTGSRLNNVEFDISFANVIGVEKVNGHTAPTGTSFTEKTDSNGEILFENIRVQDPSQPVTVTLTETQAPVGYKKVEPIVVNLVLNTSTYEYEVQKVSGNEKEFKDSEATVTEKSKITLKVKDIPIMNLGGIVWEDTQTGSKVVTGPNGKFDTSSEEGMAGVLVKLYDASGNQITKDVYGRDLIVKTAGTTDEQGNTISSPVSSVTYDLYNGTTHTIDLQQGEYIFPNIEAGTDYYVEFTYDGLNYKTVTAASNVYHMPIPNPKESKVEEDATERANFNKKFQTISDSSTGDSTSESYAEAQSLGDNLTYVPTGIETSNGIKTSKLITKDNNANVLDNYKMSVKSAKYLKQASDSKGTWIDSGVDKGKIKRNHYALDINCGLTYRFFDLAIGMDVESAKLTINGKSTTYDYNKILDGALSDIQLDELLDDNISDNKGSADGIIYNLYLYYSDYMYRIDDYITDGITNRFEPGDSAELDTLVTDVNQELRAFVTYKVIIKNQSKVEEAKVNELAYYYDENYKFVSAEDAAGNTITFVDDPSLDQVSGKTSARVSGFAQDLNSSNDYRQELYLTFEVKKSAADRSLPVDIGCANIVEILSYSTDEGLADNDSCPGNIETFGYEDDTDKARGLKIEIKNEERKISGTVWDDGRSSTANGKLDSGENEIEDVIVQLIEVKAIQDASGNTKYYEYIWKETVSGDGTKSKYISNGNLHDLSWAATPQTLEKLKLMDEDDDGKVTDESKKIVSDMSLYAPITVTPSTNPKLYEYLDYWQSIGRNKDVIDRTRYDDPQYTIFLEVIDAGFVNDNQIIYNYIDKIYDVNCDGRITAVDTSIMSHVIQQYSNATNASLIIGGGAYEFTGFIPGNYIIRFIYGDGTVYDITDNIEKYNGQDYKSTEDMYYNQEWYNEQINNYKANVGDNPSVARDNEARRLEVMPYSTTIHADLGATLKSLNKEFSELTAAETAKLQSYYTNVFLVDTTYRDWVQLKYNEYKDPDIADLTTATPEQQYELLKYYVSQKTWMAAETSKINVPVDAKSDSTTTPGKAVEEKTANDNTAVSFDYIVDRIEYNDVNFGLSLRPETKLELEKHITGIKITPNGTGVQSIVEAQAEDIVDIVNNTNPDGAPVDTKGLKNGLTAMSSTRDSRGFWKVETDVEELAQGAILEIEYTYVIKNVSTEDDYLSSYLVSAYESYYNGVKLDPTYDTYEQLLQGKGLEIKTATKGKPHSYGTYLGQHYYTGTVGGSDALVSSRAETLEEALNEKLGKQENVGDYFTVRDATADDLKVYVDTNGAFISAGKDINTVIESNSPGAFLTRKLGTNFTPNDTDWSKTAKLTTVLASITNGEIGGEYASYLAEIVEYSSASGRRNMEAEPDNRTYIDSKDTELTLNNSWQYELGGNSYITQDLSTIPAGATKIENLNEIDEFWGETIIISKPTGEDKITGIQIAIIATASVAILGVGIVLIKKFILKK